MTNASDENSNLSYVAGGNVKWHNHFENFGSFFKIYI